MTRADSSYRDPSGFVYEENGILKRQVNPVFFREYDLAKSSGIYQKLFEKGWLVSHEEIERDEFKIVLQPNFIPFISYPYEWSFTQYKHAAQLTLRLQIYLLEHGFCLKDATAFNITFHNGRAVFIDTLSIVPYIENEPWRALLQFEMHFFAVLLMAQKYGAQHLKSLVTHINGLDLSQVVKLLGWSSRLHPVIYPHIHLLAKINDRVAASSTAKTPRVSKKEQLDTLKVLDMHISKMSLKDTTEWSDYYDQTNYTDASFSRKKDVISTWSDSANIHKVIDLGGNDGTFARDLPPSIEEIIVCDIDQNAIDHCYKTLCNSQNKRILPVVLDLMQPSPAIGFHNKERDSFISRIKAYQPDLCLALALIHHLTLTGNVPFDMSASFLATISKKLIIEFPDREDSWVQYILDSKRDARHLFDHYNLSNFKKAFSKYFSIEEEQKLLGTSRTMFLMHRL